MKAQEGPGGHRRAQEATGGPRRAPESAGESWSSEEGPAGGGNHCVTLFSAQNSAAANDLIAGIG